MHSFGLSINYSNIHDIFTDYQYKMWKYLSQIRILEWY
jgi:hypothetical protein